MFPTFFVCKPPLCSHTILLESLLLSDLILVRCPWSWSTWQEMVVVHFEIWKSQCLCTNLTPPHFKMMSKGEKSIGFQFCPPSQLFSYFFSIFATKLWEYRKQMGESLHFIIFRADKSTPHLKLQRIVVYKKYYFSICYSFFFFQKKYNRYPCIDMLAHFTYGLSKH